MAFRPTMDCRRTSSHDAEHLMTTHGLLRAPKQPKPPPPHICNPPGIFMRAFHYLVGHPIRVGSMYRCPTCNTFHILKSYDSMDDLYWSSIYYDGDRQWRKLGGTLDKGGETI